MTRPASKRVLIYTEAVPVRRDVVANGLHRAASPILKSIKDHIDGVVIAPVWQWFGEGDLDPDLAHLCSWMPRLPIIFCKALRRYPAFDLGLSDVLPALVLARTARKSQADILFAFVGSDYGMLTRAARLATSSGKSCVYFVVDDFIASLRLAGVKEKTVLRAMEKAGTALRAAKHVFAITDGLCENLRENYGVSPTRLSLAFEMGARPVLSPKRQVIYVGSINVLYAEGLRGLLEVVDQVRRTDGVELTVRLTVPAEVAARELGELPPFVISAPIETSEALAREIASSLFAFLPYSFDLCEKAMVTTSFPSKSLEYLAYARSIVVNGPDYGVATKLFRKMGLPSVVSSPWELKETVLSHLRTWPEHSVVYRRYLTAEHSLEAVGDTIREDLGLAQV
jgi:hypothetical protein